MPSLSYDSESWFRDPIRLYNESLYPSAMITYHNHHHYDDNIMIPMEKTSTSTFSTSLAMMASKIRVIINMVDMKMISCSYEDV